MVSGELVLGQRRAVLPDNECRWAGDQRDSQVCSLPGGPARKTAGEDVGSPVQAEVMARYNIAATRAAESNAPHADSDDRSVDSDVAGASICADSAPFAGRVTERETEDRCQDNQSSASPAPALVILAREVAIALGLGWPPPA